jgi:hypothetical protein
MRTIVLSTVAETVVTSRVNSAKAQTMESGTVRAKYGHWFCRRDSQKT